MGRGRKARPVARVVEDGTPEIVCGENKDGNVPQPETAAEQVSQLPGATSIVSGSKKSERKYLGGTRRSQRLQSPAAVATPTPVSLDVDQDFTVVEGEEEEEEEGRHVTQPEIPDEQRNQLTGAALTVDGAKKSESKHLGRKRWLQHLQSPAAVATPPAGRLDAERLIQDMTVVGGEEEEEEEEEEGGKELLQQGNATYEMMLKERCDYMELMLQEHKMILEGLTTHKGTKRNFSGETTFDGELSYKNLYFESQKKVAALMEENQQLIRKLEKAHGQIEVYEKLTNAILNSKANTKDTDLSVNEATRTPYISQDIGNGKNAKRKKEANDN